MPPTTPHFTLAAVRQIAAIAAGAGQLILAIRREADMGVVAKADGSPVTRADWAAQNHIVTQLEQHGLMAACVAEESANQPDVDMDRGFYLIDPLDGTKAFVAGSDDFTVNIAFIRRHWPVMGVLHVPVPGITYYSDGSTAWRVDASGNTQPIHARTPSPAGLEIITNRTEDWSGQLGRYLQNHTLTHPITRLSSAYKLGLLAEGRYDLYPRFGPTAEWDIAAGDAILRAAGGMVETLDGQPLTYGKPRFGNPAFVARGRR